MNVAALFSGGKDSSFALRLVEEAGHEITYLVTLVSENPESYMFHIPNIEITKLQAEAIGLPLVEKTTKGEKEKEAVEAGADHAGGDELITKIKGGWLEFDKTVATPDMMGSVGKIGKILGPRGLMPNAKLGTVTFDLGKVVKEIKAGKIDFRVEKSGIVHAPVGRVSFGADRILENITTFMESIVRMKPAASKGAYIRSIGISTTMGPGIKIDPANVKVLLT